MVETITISKPESKEEIIISPIAAQQVHKIRAENNLPESYGLRVGVSDTQQKKKFQSKKESIGSGHS